METKKKTFLIPRLQQVVQQGIMVDRYSQDFPKEICGKTNILPCYYLILTHQGSARVIYDAQEATLVPNMVVLVHPGHMVQFVDRTDDYVFSRLVIMPELFQEMLLSVSHHNANRYHTQPAYMMNDEQVAKLMEVLGLLASFAEYNEQEVQYRRKLLVTQLAVGYELLNFYRSELDKENTASHQAELLNRFCDLVVKHYRESREVKYYAEQLNITAKHLSKVVYSATGGITPSAWIEQYVITQAKQLLEYQRTCSLKEIAYKIGFNEPTSFYRYFKKATGVTAKEYRYHFLSKTAAETEKK